MSELPRGVPACASKPKSDRGRSGALSHRGAAGVSARLQQGWSGCGHERRVLDPHVTDVLGSRQPRRRLGPSDDLLHPLAHALAQPVADRPQGPEVPGERDAALFAAVLARAQLDRTTLGLPQKPLSQQPPVRRLRRPPQRRRSCLEQPLAGPSCLHLLNILAHARGSVVNGMTLNSIGLATSGSRCREDTGCRTGISKFVHSYARGPRRLQFARTN